MKYAIREPASKAGGRESWGGGGREYNECKVGKEGEELGKREMELGGERSRQAQ